MAIPIEVSPRSRPNFKSFVDSVTDKVADEGIDTEGVIPRLSLMTRKLNQLMADDAAQRVYRPGGWSHASFRICVSLWVMGPLPSHRVASMTNMSRATVSAALKKILEDELITKEPSTEDLRSVVVRLTPRGEKLIRESYQWHLEVENEWFGALTEAERHILLMLLEKIMENRPAFR
ncbi:hypothetical protein GCM10023169_34800 [Georgenia halophila]|uniref:HTH marR-type domain-containing protein n=1 Tax=Georgenia halophila TaxID=620889 RepID=A0ABP8LJN6_9MICO